MWNSEIVIIFILYFSQFIVIGLACIIMYIYFLVSLDKLAKNIKDNKSIFKYRILVWTELCLIVISFIDCLERIIQTRKQIENL